MNLPPPDLTELRHLLDALCEEAITPEQIRQLEELVLASPEAEAFYVQYMSFTADLDRHFTALPALTVPVTTVKTPRSRLARLLLGGSLGLTGLAALILFALLMPPLTRDRSSHKVDAGEPTDTTVAVLLQAHGAEWENANSPRTGASLAPGVLRLKSGYAHIEFYSGASVILEGPAEFRLVSRTEAYCTYGKLRATVPAQGHAFTIGSPRVNLVETASEFGLQVKQDGPTEVHVFQGKVDLYDAGTNQKTAPQEVAHGHSVRVDGPGVPRAIASNPMAFRGAEYLAERARDEARQRHSAWLEACAERRKDKTLIVYYTFEAENAWTRTLPDLARGAKEKHDGAIIGCTWATGRWPGKQGLEFKGVTDHVRLTVPGDFESITLTAWVRIDDLPNKNNSLFLADGWDEGELHWQIGENGTIILGVQSSPKAGAHYHAPAAITPDHLGQWLHLAVVYDATARQVTHYLDGRVVGRDSTQFDIPLRIGSAEIGNWNLAMHKNNNPVRHFRGCIDEFMMFSRPLNAQEIADQYTQGRPTR